MARHPSSVCPSVCLSVNFLHKSLLLQTNGWIATKLAHDGFQVSMHPGCAQGQGQGRMIWALLCWQENRFFSQANGWIATILAQDGLQVSLHLGCAQGQGHLKGHVIRALLCCHENSFFS